MSCDLVTFMSHVTLDVGTVNNKILVAMEAANMKVGQSSVASLILDYKVQKFLRRHFDVGCSILRKIRGALGLPSLLQSCLGTVYIYGEYST